MARIQVVPIGSGEFQVEVDEDGITSTHDVTVPAGYLAELGLEDAVMGDVVHESFRFLLQREPRDAILREFELPVIARYFPEYPDEIARRIRTGDAGKHG
jgi:hypothetical protein